MIIDAIPELRRGIGQMEVVRWKTSGWRVKGVMTTTSRELLGLLDEQSGPQKFRGGTLDGDRAIVHLEDIHPNRIMRTGSELTWQAVFEIPNLKGTEITPSPDHANQVRRLVRLGIIPITFNERGRGRLQVSPAEVLRFKLSRAIMGGVEVVQEERHGGPRPSRRHCHAEYYPDHPKLNIGVTVPNYPTLVNC